MLLGPSRSCTYCNNMLQSYSSIVGTEYNQMGEVARKQLVHLKFSERKDGAMILIQNVDFADASVSFIWIHGIFVHTIQ